MLHMLKQPLALTRRPFSPWIVILAGLAFIYVPSFIDLFQGAWSSERNAHGPMVLGVASFFLFYRVRQLLAQGLIERAPAPLAGGAMLIVGLLFYAVGRSQSVLLLEVGSLVVVLSSLVVSFFGLRTWSRMWFAFFFMLFMIPLPASVVDVVTLPMKISVSYATEHLLYWMGYPIARSGVILNIGQYQLLVADACAGLNSLFTLEALGLLYMNMVRHPSVVRNAVLGALIIPISFAANTIRIVFLALITYYMGDAAGQGFLHGLSGMVLFLSALLLIIGVDGLLSRLVRGRHAEAALPAAPKGPSMASLWARHAVIEFVPAFAMLAAMVLAVAAAHALTPVFDKSKPFARLEQSLPKRFGDWTEIPSTVVQADLATTPEGATDSNQPYDDVLMRTYVNGAGEQVMLALAYAREQRQDVKVHLPEICYQAGGYKVVSLAPASLAVLPGGASVPGKHMLARNNNRSEAVSYWVRIGDGYPRGGMAARMKIFRDGMAGKVVDGILVRSSMQIRDEADAAKSYAVQEGFLKQMVAAVVPDDKQLVAVPPR